MLHRPVPLLFCILPGCQSPETRMRTAAVIIMPPGFDGLARFPQIDKPVLVQAHIAKPTIEAFAESVLHRLAGLDIVPGDARCRPPQDRNTR